VDRCALFVDASYVLADGAMAVHGTRQRESVSWDYAGLVKLLTGLSRDRTGLPVLRCYWYEATVEGRRTSEHNALADLPGVKLRLGRVRPGRREGVEAGMHRDLTTLARNRAVSDAVIVSAEEDLTEVVAEVQDLGLRAVIVHIAAEGNWTVPRPLRQESDDIVEVTGAHLRPFVDLNSAAEPSDADEQYRNGSHQRRSLANGHGNGIGAVTQQGLPAAALPPAPTIYTSPVVEDYQRASAGAEQPAATAQPQAPAAAPSPPASPQPAHAAQAQGSAAPAPAQPQAAVSAQAPAPPQPAPPQPAASPAPADAQAQAAGRVQAPAGAPDQNAGQPQAPSQAEIPAQAQLPAQPAAVAHALAAQAQDPRQAQAPGAQQPPSLPPQQAQAAPQAQAPAGAQPVSQAPAPAPQAPAPAQPQAQAAAPGPAHAQPQPQAPVQPQAALPPQLPPPAPAPQGAPQHLAAPTPTPGYGPVPGGQWPAEAAPNHGRQGPPGPQMPPQPGQGGGRFGPGQGDYRAPNQAGSAQGRFGELPAPQRYDGQGRYAEPPAQGRFADNSAPGRYAEGPPSARFAEGPGQGAYGDAPGPAQYPPGPPALPTPPGAFGAGSGGQMPYPPQYPALQPGQHGASGPPGYQQQEQGPYSGPQSAAHANLPAPVAPPMAISLADAVQAAHAEGFGFGDAVARDAPALWLEAVLARKPRMPSDLEARLLQGSALPIDSLLHDEVRHSLRRGFWDALERSRR